MLIHKDLGKLAESNFIYCLAGGAVRSHILGLPIKDYDYYLYIPEEYVEEDSLVRYVCTFALKMGWDCPSVAETELREGNYSVSKGLLVVYNTKDSEGGAVQIMAMRGGSPRAWVVDFSISTGEFLQLPCGKIQYTNWANTLLKAGVILYGEKHIDKPKYLERMRTYFPDESFNMVVDRGRVEWLDYVIDA
jgi:hypothetical protein